MKVIYAALVSLPAKRPSSCCQQQLVSVKQLFCVNWFLLLSKFHYFRVKFWSSAVGLKNLPLQPCKNWHSAPEASVKTSSQITEKHTDASSCWGENSSCNSSNKKNVLASIDSFSLHNNSEQCEFFITRPHGHIYKSMACLIRRCLNTCCLAGPTSTASCH